MIRRSTLGVDTIGWLRQQLTGLGGFATMLHELLQNAEDEGCEWIEIEFKRDALIVRNPSVFDEADWDRITLLASGGKALEESAKIGTFGVGFISVYQITDCPEIISAAEHVVFRPQRQLTGTEPSIEWLGTPKHLPGTEFRLPWARTSSPLRQRLEQPPVSEEAISGYWDVAIVSLPDALVFLRSLRCVRLRRGKELVEIRREDSESGGAVTWRAIVVARDGQWAQRFDWLMAESDLPRPLNVPSVRADRRAHVALAIPQVEDIRSFVGRLFSFLPTQHLTGLRFHVHGTFFAKSDRKGIERDGINDRVTWNRALLEGVAPLLGEIAPGLWHELGFRGFFDLIPLPDFESREFPELNVIKPTLEAVAKVHPLVPDRGGKPCQGTEVCFGDGLTEDELDVLELLGARFVHPEALSFRNWLTKFGVQPFGLAQLCKLPLIAGLRDGQPLSTAPVAVRDATQRCVFYGALAKLLGSLGTRRPKGHKPEMLPWGVSAAGTLRPFAAIWPVSESTCTLFEAFIGKDRFWETGIIPELPDEVIRLSPGFSVCDAIGAVEASSTARVDEIQKDRPEVLPRLYIYFQREKSSLAGNPLVVGRLKSLPIFLSTDGKLRALWDLSLPGPFVDPLRLGTTLDLETIASFLSQRDRRELRRFLEDLDVLPLSLETYCRKHVAKYFNDLQHQASEPWPNTALEILDLLRGHLRYYQDNEDILETFRGSALVPCSTGLFVRADQVYLPSGALDAVFGPGQYPRPSHQLTEGLQPGWKDFYSTLGVRTSPAVSDVVESVRKTARLPASDDPHGRLKALYEFLNENYEHFEENDRELVASLAGVPWLPIWGKEETLAEPSRVFTPARRHLFETQADFIAFDEPSRAFREALQLRVEPEPRLVVAHLIERARDGASVHREVYRFLNLRADDLAIGRLRGQPCIDLGSGRYARGDRVFFDEVPFGRYRHHLAPELQEFRRFCEAVGVRPASQLNASDYAAVLGDISAEYGSSNRMVDEHAKAVITTIYRWAHSQLEAGEEITPAFRDLRKEKCVLANNDLLYTPSRVLLGDKSYFAEEFKLQLKDQILVKDRTTWRALRECLGVKTLSESVAVKVARREGEAVDQELTLHVRIRKPFFQRVIETRKQDQQAGWNETILDRLEVRRVAALEAVWELTNGDIFLQTARKHLDVWYDAGVNAILLAGDALFPGLRFARELGMAVNEDIDPSYLVPLFDRILLEEDLRRIDQYLDDAGVDRLSDVVPTKIERSGEVTDMGTNSVESTGTQLRTATPGAKPSIESEAEGQKEGKRQQRGGFERRSFVRVHIGHGSALPGAEGKVRERRQTEKSAIDTVKEYEAANGRSVESVESKDCGWDLESRESSREVRYIEVKGLREEWSGYEILLTQNEFQAAWELAERYYLYVVDRIATGQPRIQIVQDPAHSGDYFAFDNPDANVSFDDPATEVKS